MKIQKNEPRYGVTTSASHDFSVASFDVFAWFSSLRPAVILAEQLLTENHEIYLAILDLNNGVEVLEEWEAVW